MPSSFGTIWFRIALCVLICFVGLIVVGNRNIEQRHFEILANNQQVINHNQAIGLTELGIVLDMRVMDSLLRIKIETLSKPNKVKFNATLDGVISRCEKRKSILDSIQLGLNSCTGLK